jgi:cell fate regulator YaaT (PSP1 superfamily)
MRQVGFFRHDLDRPPPAGTKVVVRTERGVELGQVVIAVGKKAQPHCMTHERLNGFLERTGSDYPFRRDGKVLRAANVQDIIDYRHLESSAVDEGNFCRQQIRELSLKMKLVTVEHLLGGERIIFYFAAEQRVDFRELVRRLAAQFRTRIEMRQVGARDEARLVADYERCGMQCCCQRFLKDLKPVSMRMAKTQKATLDPSKISGRCGRLMCCLRYEDAGYEELRKRLPRKNTWVRTKHTLGRVIETQILTQLVRLALPDDTQVVVANEEILERDVAPPPPPEPPPEKARDRPKRLREKAGPRLLRDEVAVATAEPELKPKPEPQPQPKPAPAAEAEPADASQEAPAEAPQREEPVEEEQTQPERRPPRRRRRRRRPKKKRTTRASEQARRPQTKASGKPQSQQPPAAASTGRTAQAGSATTPPSDGGEKKSSSPGGRRRRGRRRRKKRP